MNEDVELNTLVQRIQFMVFDFDGVFTDNRVLVLEDGTEGVICNRSDGIGLETVRKIGMQLLVISKEQNSVVSARCRKLRLPCIQGCDDKLKRLREEAKKLAIEMQNIAYMGNDINDVACLKAVGLPVCVADAYQEAVRLAKFVTEKKGGEGAVREFCDLVARIKSKSSNESPNKPV